MVFVFGYSFQLLAFMLFGSLAIIVASTMMNNNPKNARTLGLAVLVLGAILEILNLRFLFLLNLPAIFRGSLPAINGLIAASGGLLSVIGGALALSWNPHRQRAVQHTKNENYSAKLLRYFIIDCTLPTLPSASRTLIP